VKHAGHGYTVTVKAPGSGLEKEISAEALMVSAGRNPTLTF